MSRTLRLQLPMAAVKSKCHQGAALNHYKGGRIILPLKNRRFTLCLSLQQQSPPSDSSNHASSTVGLVSTPIPIPIHLSNWTLSHRHIHILSFIACAAAISATWLFCSAIPALLAFRRAAESMEKLMDVWREELPDTMAAVRLSGMELTDLTSELSELGQELTKGVKNSTRAVRKAEENLRQFTNMASSAYTQEVAPMGDKESGPVLARTPRRSANRAMEGIVKARSFVQMLLNATVFLRILYNYLKPRTNKS